MDFTNSGRLRRSGRRWLGWGLAAFTGSVAWLLTAHGDARSISYLAVPFTALITLVGVRDLRRSRRPFLLRIDSFGITLHDGDLSGDLSWGQIEAIGLRYGESINVDAGPERSATLPEPHLHVYPAEGAELPGRRLRRIGGRRAQDLVDCAEVDQGIDALIDALKRYAGPRFEGAPQWMRRAAPSDPAAFRGPGFGPLTDSAGTNTPGPAQGTPRDAVAAGPAGYGERVFVARQNTAARLLIAVTVAAAGTLGSVVYFSGGPALGPDQVVSLWPLAGLAGWAAGFRLFPRWVRPLRLRIGPDGIAMRDFADTELVFRWDQIVAVTVGRRPGTSEPHQWLVLWPVPGEKFSLPRTQVVEGHETYALVELRRLRNGDHVAEVTRHFAGHRYAERS